MCFRFPSSVLSCLILCIRVPVDVWVCVCVRVSVITECVSAVCVAVHGCDLQQPPPANLADAHQDPPPGTAWSPWTPSLSRM